MADCITATITKDDLTGAMTQDDLTATIACTVLPDNVYITNDAGLKTTNDAETAFVVI